MLIQIHNIHTKRGMGMDQKSIQEMKKGFATAYINGNLASNA